MQDRILRLVPGASAAKVQVGIWRTQMSDLRPLYPIVIPYLLWLFIRNYNKEQERLRLSRVAPVLLPDKRLPEDRQKLN